MEGVSSREDAERKLQHASQLEEPVRRWLVGRRREEASERVMRESAEVDRVFQEVIVPALEGPDPRHRSSQDEKAGREESGSSSSRTGSAMVEHQAGSKRRNYPQAEHHHMVPPGVSNRTAP